MRISMVSSSGAYEKELKRLLNQSIKPYDLQPCATRAVGDLRVKTPKRTGKTAERWSSEVTKTGSGIDIIIKNDNTTKDGIPIPILIKNGHGTGTGGYVPPNDFISPIMTALVKDVSSLVERKLK